MEWYNLSSLATGTAESYQWDSDWIAELEDRKKRTNMRIQICSRIWAYHMAILSIVASINIFGA